MEGMSISELLGKIDKYNNNYDFNNSNDDLYYSDFISNYEEV